MDVVKEFYDSYYSRVFSGEGLSSKFNSITHKAMESKIERFFVLNPSKKYSILEIGAGKGEHFSYVKKPFDAYHMLDILPKPIEVGGFPNTKWIQEDICNPKIKLGRYDRIISMCVFHHLAEPALAIENIKNSLKVGGVFSLFLPSDPGILNRVVRKFFVTPAAKKLGFQYYELVNAREHKNHYWGLKKELEYQFQGYEVSKKYYPFGIPAGNLSLFSIWHFKKTGIQSFDELKALDNQI
jgi:phosphatidylethanolamine/phosphatidyl-N-methylethanolamine N-methyltransferase